MRLHMIIKLLARELALADFILVLVRRDAVFFDAVAVAVLDGFGGIGVGVVVRWLGGFGSARGGRGGRRERGGGVVEGCGAEGGGGGEPGELVGVLGLGWEGGCFVGMQGGAQ
jgi:hypothetical protein